MLSTISLTSRTLACVVAAILLHSTTANDGLYYTIIKYLAIISVLFLADCRIADYDVFEYNDTELMPREIDGYFVYTVPCGGTLTSVKARGFCMRENNVELRLIYGYYDNMGQLQIDYELVKAECNASTSVMSKFYEGKVTNDSLSLVIPQGGFFSITLISDCSKTECYFQPAIINKTSNYILKFGVSVHLISHTDLSLLFSANIEQFNKTYGNNKDDHKNHSINTTLVIVLSLLFCASFIVSICILVFLLIKRKQKKRRIPQLPNV